MKQKTQHIFIVLFVSMLCNISQLAYASEPLFLDATEAFKPHLAINNDKLKVEWSIQDGYYLYRKGFEIETHYNEQSIPIAFSIQNGEKKYDSFFEEEVEIYHQHATTLSTLGPLNGKPFKLILTSQGCADAGLCYPPTAYEFFIDEHSLIKNKVSENIVSGSEETNNAEKEKKERLEQPKNSIKLKKINKSLDVTQIITTLIGAVLGGLILNLMPCVFPVLSMKAMSLAAGHTSIKTQRLHGWAYTLGVVGSFVVAAVIILIARTAGESLGWGFQLQSPIFVTLMVYLFFTMGLSFSGAVEFGGRFMGAGQQLTAGHSFKSSFFTGVLAALVASPCTAPFMATALGVALTQPVLISLTIFIALGFGMALPFLALSYMPTLSRVMPKPGHWMLVFKQALAFPLYLTVIWLLWVLSHQASSLSIVLTLVGLLLIVFALWLAQLPEKNKNMQFIRNVISLICIALSIIIASQIQHNPVQNEGEIEKQFTFERLNKYRQNGVPVFIDLTADWCLTCKVNEKIALTPKVIQTLQDKGIVVLVGDWTNANDEISQLLQKHQRSGIPLYLMYPIGQGEPEILPQILTKDIVIAAAHRALLQ